MAMTTPTSYRWLTEYLGDSDLTANKIADLLAAHAFEIEAIRELKDDTVIDVDILPNRSSDCLCHRGIAREIASIINKPLKNDPITKEITLPATDKIEVTIADGEACPRFTASLIKNVTVSKSPQWLKDRLETIGQRSINNIVDATNYVMFSIGQPIHAYDADLFPNHEGSWKFDVRYAKSGEKIHLLSDTGKTEERIVELDGTELLIVDGSSDTPIGLAGVKGGAFAGIHAGTKNIIIEAAHFNPGLTRKTARRLGIVIDASKRFENEPSRELPMYAQAEVLSLIEDIAGGTTEGVIDKFLLKKEPETVSVSLTKTNALLGLDLTRDQVKNILERIGAVVVQTETGFNATAPFERTDLNIEEDYIEEVGRIHGYEHISAVVPEKVALNEINKRHYYSELIRETLTRIGFSEVITSSFRNKDQIQLQNALAADKSYLRSDLTGGLQEVLTKNISHKDILGMPYIAAFEIGTVFRKGEDGIIENFAVSLGVRHKHIGLSKPDTKILESAEAALESVLGTQIQFVEKDGVAEFDLTNLLTTIKAPTSYNKPPESSDIVYKTFSNFPAIVRDVAVWVDDSVSSSELESVINEQAGPLRIRTNLFDTFSKDNRTSYAFRLVFQSDTRTLLDSEVNNIMKQVYKALEELNCEIR